MSRTKVAPAAERDTQSASSSLLLPVIVGLAIVFLLITPLFSAAKSHAPLFSESNLLYVALIFYAGATALYMALGVTGRQAYVKYASLATLLGWLANTAAVAHRWYGSGRPPFANVYEMLLSFVWTVALLTLIAEKKYGVRIVGSITMPLAVVCVVLMQLLPSDVHPLVPALQSTWLHVHVTLAMLSYAACAVSFALALMFLIQDNMTTETFHFWTSALVALIFCAIVLTRFNGGGLAVAAWDPQGKRDLMMEDNVRVFVTIPELGWLMLLAAASSIVPLGLNIYARLRRFSYVYDWADRAMFVSILLQIASAGAFVLRARNGFYPAFETTLLPTALPASPFLLGGMIVSIFASLLYLMLLWRRPELQKLLPSSGTLDLVTYRAIGIAFPLLTGMIAVGAYWANRTWGRYWGWDPKETWALVTWLIYAGYLHTRITHGWRGRRAAYAAILGFVAVVFTFLGVTYLLGGKHAY